MDTGYLKNHFIQWDLPVSSMLVEGVCCGPSWSRNFSCWGSGEEPFLPCLLPFGTFLFLPHPAPMWDLYPPFWPFIKNLKLALPAGLGPQWGYAILEVAIVVLEKTPFLCVLSCSLPSLSLTIFITVVIFCIIILICSSFNVCEPPRIVSE